MAQIDYDIKSPMELKDAKVTHFVLPSAHMITPFMWSND